MRRRRLYVLIVFLFMLISASGVLAEEIGAPVRVNVYPCGVDATWIVPAEPVMTFILPSSFKKDRIRYHIQEGAIVQHLDVVYEDAGEWMPEGLVELVSKISLIQNELVEISSELSGVLQTLAYLETKVDLGQQKEPLDFILKAQIIRVENERKRQHLEARHREKERLLRGLKSRVREWYAGDLEKVLRVTMLTNGTGEIELTAFSPHANWTMFYRARLDSDQNKVSLDTYVSVWQRTGLVWEGEIFTHTASPADVMTVPILSPLVVRGKERGVFYSMEFEKSVGYQDQDMVQIEGEAMVTFAGQGVVQSDNKPALLKAKTEELAVQTFQTLVPSRSERAWLLVETEQPVRALLRGDAEFTVDGTLSGSGVLTHPGGSELLQIAFGHPPLITAERTSIVYTEHRTWLGRNTVRSDGYYIDVHNGTSREANVVVKDRVPISGHDQIKVTPRFDPEPDEQEEGVLVWNLTLFPGESTRIIVEYEIEYPTRMNLFLN